MTKCRYCMKRIWPWHAMDDWSINMHKKCADWIAANAKPFPWTPIKGRTVTVAIIDETAEFSERFENIKNGDEP